MNPRGAIVGGRPLPNASVVMWPGQNIARAELELLIDLKETVAICGCLSFGDAVTVRRRIARCRGSWRCRVMKGVSELDNAA